jgi:hypothetical protein
VFGICLNYLLFLSSAFGKGGVIEKTAARNIKANTKEKVKPHVKLILPEAVYTADMRNPNMDISIKVPGRGATLYMQSPFLLNSL